MTVFAAATLTLTVTVAQWHSGTVAQSRGLKMSLDPRDPAQGSSNATTSHKMMLCNFGSKCITHTTGIFVFCMDKGATPFEFDALKKFSILNGRTLRIVDALKHKPVFLPGFIGWGYRIASSVAEMDGSAQ